MALFLQWKLNIVQKFLPNSIALECVALVVWLLLFCPVHPKSRCGSSLDPCFQAYFLFSQDSTGLALTYVLCHYLAVGWTPEPLLRCAWSCCPMSFLWNKLLTLSNIFRLPILLWLWVCQTSSCWSFPLVPQCLLMRKETVLTDTFTSLYNFSVVRTNTFKCYDSLSLFHC